MHVATSVFLDNGGSVVFPLHIFVQLEPFFQKSLTFLRSSRQPRHNCASFVGEMYVECPVAWVLGVDGESFDRVG